VSQLSWSSAHTPKQAIPQTQLYSGVTTQAPSNLTATAASSTQVDLEWIDHSSNETGFAVERKQGAEGTWQLAGIVAANTTSYIDAGLNADTSYTWRVKAANFDTNSPYSNEVALTTPIPPNTPSGAHPTAVTENSISLAWTDNSNNETRFAIFRKTGTAGAFVFIAELPPDTTQYMDGGRLAGTYYDYHVQAGNVAGFSDFAGFSVTTLTLPPTTVTPALDGSNVRLSWDPSLGANSYRVYRGTSPAAESMSSIATVVELSYVDVSVQTGQLYYYRVSAITTGGEGSLSEPVSVRTPVLLVGDFDHDGDIDSADLATLLSEWTGRLDPNTGGHDADHGDLDGDTDVDSSDLITLLAAWRPPAVPPATAAGSRDPGAARAEGR
jgi:Fibronectin type III domain